MNSAVLPPAVGGDHGGEHFGLWGGAGGTFPHIHFPKTPPHSGGDSGGSFSSFGGERGGALPPILEGPSYTLSVA